MEDIRDRENIKRMYFRKMNSIMERLTLAEYITDEDGNRDYLPYRVRLSKNDIEAIKIFTEGKKVLLELNTLDFGDLGIHERLLVITERLMLWIIRGQEEKIGVR